MSERTAEFDAGKLEHVVGVRGQQTAQADLIVAGQDFIAIPPIEQERMSAPAGVDRHDDSPAAGRKAVDHGVDQFRGDCRLIAQGDEHRAAGRGHRRQAATDRGQHVGPLVVGVDDDANRPALERLAEAVRLMTGDDADLVDAAAAQFIDDVPDDRRPARREEAASWTPMRRD